VDDLPCNPPTEEAPEIRFRNLSQNTRCLSRPHTENATTRTLLRHLNGGVFVAEHHTADVDCPNRLPFTNVR
jgi:hypothetical protein